MRIHCLTADITNTRTSLSDCVNVWRYSCCREKMKFEQQTTAILQTYAAGRFSLATITLTQKYDDNLLC
jgi:hypothetical protein